jgi:hypothetical protein
MERLYGLNYRLVDETDSEFIVSLRAMEKLSRFLHPTESNVNNQIEWIREYKRREADGLDYYYIFEDDLQRRLGLSRIYNIHDDDVTIGSWIFRPDAFLGTSILGDIIVKEIAFRDLKKNTCLFDVRKGNIHVINYHMTYHPKRIGEDDLNYYFELDRQSFDQGKKRYLKLLHNQYQGVIS